MFKRFSLIVALVLSLLARPAGAQILENTRTRSADLDTASECSVLGVAGMGTGSVQVSGTYTGTISFTVSVDGTNYTALDVATPSDPSTTINSTTSTGVWSGSVAAMRFLRACMTSYTSGTAVVTLSSSLSGGGSGGSVTANVSGGNEAASATGSAVPAKADYNGLNIGGNLTGQTGVSVGSARAGAVAIVDGSGNQITSFGGGTQYAEAATAATITGTAVMFESNTGSNTLSVVNNTTPLPVSDAGGSLTVDGTVSVTGVATAAKQPALGTAGTASADVISVQGIASMTPLLVNGSAVTQPVSDAGGSLTVDNGGTFAVQAAQSGTWTVQPGNTANTTPWLATISQGGNAATVNGSGQLSITCANCSGSGASAVDDAAFSVASGSGAPAMGLFNNSTPDSVNEGDTGVIRMSANRNLFSTLRDAAGNERGANVTASNALVVDGSAVTQPVSGSVTVTQGTGTNLHIVCDSGCSSSTAPADNSAFTAGTTSQSPVGGFYHASRDTVTDGRIAALAISSKRGLFVSPETPNGDSAMDETNDALKVVNATAANFNATVSQATGTNLHVVCDSGCSSSTAPADNSAFTAGTTSSSPMSGFYHASRDTLTDGRVGTIALTSKRAIFTALETPNGDSAMNDTADAIKTLAVDSTGATITPSTLATHDTALGTITNVTGGVPQIRASAAAPTDVSADGDAVIPWALRSGAQVFQPSYAGVLASTGVGAAGTGTPRVVDVASGSTGSAPPTQASYIGGIGSGATGGLMAGVTVCDSQAFLDMTTATTTELVALTASRKVYLCTLTILSNGTTTVTLKRGTGTNCGTGTTSISPAWDLTAQTGLAMGTGVGVVFDNQNAGDALCVTNSAAVNLHVLVRYAKY